MLSEYQEILFTSSQILQTIFLWGILYCVARIARNTNKK